MVRLEAYTKSVKCQNQVITGTHLFSETLRDVSPLAGYLARLLVPFIDALQRRHGTCIQQPRHA